MLRKEWFLCKINCFQGKNLETDRNQSTLNRKIKIKTLRYSNFGGRQLEVFQFWRKTTWGIRIMAEDNVRYSNYGGRQLEVFQLWRKTTWGIPILAEDNLRYSNYGGRQREVFELWRKTTWGIPIMAEDNLRNNFGYQKFKKGSPDVFGPEPHNL